MSHLHFKFDRKEIISDCGTNITSMIALTAMIIKCR